MEQCFSPCVCVCLCVNEYAPMAMVYFMLCQISPSPILQREDMGHTLLAYSCVCVLDGLKCLAGALLMLY